MTKKNLTIDERHAVCPRCEMIVTKDTEELAQKVVDQHNYARHSRKQAAEVVGPSSEDLEEYMNKMKREYGIEVYRDFALKLIEEDPWGVGE